MKCNLFKIMKNDKNYNLNFTRFFLIYFIIYQILIIRNLKYNF